MLVCGEERAQQPVARIALRLRADLDAVHVTTSDTPSRPADQLKTLAADVGAHWHEIEDDEPAHAIAAFARQHQITQIVIGSSGHGRWRQLIGGGSKVARIIREAGALGVDVHVIARHSPAQ